jgi:hypothetical protein
MQPHAPAIIRNVKSHCPSQTQALLIATDTPFGNWRKLQYYLPEYTVIRLYAKNKNPFKIAKNRKFETHEGKILELHENCKTFWFIPSSDERIQQLKNKTVVHDPIDFSRLMYLTQGTTELHSQTMLPLKLINHMVTSIDRVLV